MSVVDFAKSKFEEAVSKPNQKKESIRCKCICQSEKSTEGSMSINLKTGWFHCFKCEEEGYLKEQEDNKAKYIWDNGTIVNNHPYTELKQIKVNEIRTDPYDYWIVPYTDKDDKIKTIQRINADEKLFLKGYKSKGASYRIDGTTDIVYVCEGPATGHSINEITGALTFCVGGKENFKSNIQWIKNKYQRIILVADNDNPGLLMVEKMSLENKLKYVIPPEPGMDVNDYFVAHGLEKSKNMFLDLKIPEIQDTIDDYNQSCEDEVLVLNKQHGCVMVNGKFQIINDEINPEDGTKKFSLSTFNDLKQRYANKKVIQKIDNANGNITTKEVCIADLWLQHPKRREYKEIVFDPSEKVSKDYYNLWQGMKYKPIKGDWSLLKKHIYEIIANEDKEIGDWIMAWMARIVQDPGGKKPGTAIVMRGAQGTGKGTFASAFGELFKPHFTHVIQSNQFLGRFNSLLAQAVVVFVDEGIWGGDKQAEGVLKGLITEQTTNIEMKHRDAFTVKNYMNFIIASNNKFVIPAGLNERRFLVLDVSSKHAKEAKYFKPIQDQLNSGGYEAMLYDLLHLDISKINLREAKTTEALKEQKDLSMTPIEAFWSHCLSEEKFHNYNPVNKKYNWLTESVTIPKSKIYDYFVNYTNKSKSYVCNDNVFWRDFKSLCPKITFSRPTINKIRTHCVSVPMHSECQKEFDKLLE